MLRKFGVPEQEVGDDVCFIVNMGRRVCYIVNRGATQPTSGAAVAAVLASCVDNSRPQQCGPNLPYFF